MNEQKTNYQHISVTTQNLAKWNDYTVLYEINLCRQALYGDDFYDLAGIFRNNECTDEARINAIDTWSQRLENAITEARRRKILSKKKCEMYLDELDLQLMIH